MRDRANEKHKRGGNNNNNRRDGKRKERREREAQEDRELEEIENALLDQTSRIIDQLMTVITTRLSERGVNQARHDNYQDNSTYERLYGNKNYHPSGDYNNNDNNNNNNNDNNNNNPNPTQNVSMNIQRPRSNISMPEEPTNMVLPGGAQLYPGQQYNPRQMRQNNIQHHRPQQRQPQVQNTYQPTTGPGGRAEAPRDNVVIGSQALQYASRVASRVGSNQVSVGRNNHPVGQTRAPVARAPAPRPMAPAPAAPMRSGPVVAQAA